MEHFGLLADTSSALELYCIVVESSSSRVHNVRLDDTMPVTECLQNLAKIEHSRLLLLRCSPSLFCMSTVQEVPSHSMWKPATPLVTAGNAMRLVGIKAQLKHGFHWFDCLITGVRTATNANDRANEEFPKGDAPVPAAPAHTSVTNFMQTAGLLLTVQLADGLVLVAQPRELRRAPIPKAALVAWLLILLAIIIGADGMLALQLLQREFCDNWCFAGVGYSQYGVMSDYMSVANLTSPNAWACAFNDTGHVIMHPLCIAIPPEIVNRLSFLLMVLGQIVLAVLYLCCVEAIRAPLLLSVPGTLWFFNWCFFLWCTNSAYRDLVPLLAIIVAIASYGVFFPIFEKGHRTVRSRNLGFIYYFVAPCIIVPVVTWAHAIASTVRLTVKRQFAVGNSSLFNDTVASSSYSDAVLQLDADIAVAQLVGPLASVVIVVVFFKVFENGLLHEWKFHWAEQVLLALFLSQNIVLMLAILPLYPDFWFKDGQGSWEFSDWWWSWQDTAFYVFIVPRLETMGILWALQLITRELLSRLAMKLATSRLPSSAAAATIAHRSRVASTTVDSFTPPTASHPSVAQIIACSKPMQAALNDVGTNLTDTHKGYIRDIFAITRRFLLGHGGHKEQWCGNPRLLSVLKGVVEKQKAPHKTIYESRVLGLASDSGFWAVMNHVDGAIGKLQQLERTCLQPRIATTDVCQQLVSTMENCKFLYPEFDEFVALVAERTGTTFSKAPMKSLYRVGEKLFLSLLAEQKAISNAAAAADEHDSNGRLEVDASLRICDIVRGMIVCSSMAEYLAVMDMLLSMDQRLISLVGRFRVLNIDCGKGESSSPHICDDECMWRKGLTNLQKTEQGIARIDIQGVGEGSTIVVYANHGFAHTPQHFVERVRELCSLEVECVCGTGHDRPILRNGLTMSARASGMDRDIVITRIKNRFMEPTEGGWYVDLATQSTTCCVVQ